MIGAKVHGTWGNHAAMKQGWEDEELACLVLLYQSVRQTGRNSAQGNLKDYETPGIMP